MIDAPLNEKMNAMTSSYASQGGTKLRIVHPFNALEDFEFMGTKGAIRAALAPFGHFQTGISITAPLYLPAVGQHGCSDMKLPEEMSDSYNMHWNGFVIVLDGICTYEEKARRVEKMGAQALIIAHDPDTFVTERFGHFSEDNRYDGSGHAITMPTIIIDSVASKSLLKMLQGNHNFENQVVLMADIEISDADSQTVSYSLYYGSLFDLSNEMLTNMYDY